jgi:hypothetical protein
VRGCPRGALLPPVPPSLIPAAFICLDGCRYAAFNGGRSHLVLQGRILEGVVVFEPNIGARGSFSHRQRHASADAARERVALALAEQAEGRTISLGADNV